VGGDLATYTASFKASTTVPAGGTITLSEGSTNFSTVTGVLVTDSTAGWHFVTTTLGGNPAAGTLTLTLPAGDAISGGDLVTVTAVNVTSPGNGTYSDFSISTSADQVAATAPGYTLSAGGTSLPTVTPNPATLGSLSTYTISNIHATAAISPSNAGFELVITAPPGTTFPNNGADYLLTDATSSTGSGTMILVTYNSPTKVTLEFPNTVNSGDLLTLTIADVINPSTSSSSDTLTLTGDVAGQTGIAPFPSANVTYPNGSLVNFGGTIYVFAGGHAFGIATPTVLSKIQAVDHAAIVKATAGAVVPNVAPRPGTLITTNSVNSNATIYVVGTDGELHGFATPGQYLGDGFDPALNVTVSTTAGLTVGATAGAEGTALTAFTTMADGSIIDSSGTYYVFDGGHAFGIPTPAALAIVRKPDTATPLSGTVTAAMTSAPIASGVLLTVAGVVYIAYVGDIWPFKSPTQFSTDGYAGTASVTATNLGGIPVVSTYSGS
jgi:hypothetical protein